MENVYINSKGEEVDIKEMKTTHILYSIAKNSRLIGAEDKHKERREVEVKAMHTEVVNRFAELSEAAAK